MNAATTEVKSLKSNYFHYFMFWLLSNSLILVNAYYGQAIPKIEDMLIAVHIIGERSELNTAFRKSNGTILTVSV